MYTANRLKKKDKSDSHERLFSFRALRLHTDFGLGRQRARERRPVVAADVLRVRHLHGHGLERLHLVPILPAATPRRALRGRQPRRLVGRDAETDTDDDEREHAANDGRHLIRRVSET